jgi:hypothetical protein
MTKPKDQEQDTEMFEQADEGEDENSQRALLLANELKKPNRRRTQQRNTEQPDPKCCWPLSERLWSHHAHEHCEECEQTASEH